MLANYGLLGGDAPESLCDACKKKYDEVIKHIDLSEAGVEEERIWLENIGLTEKGIRHLKKAIATNAPCIVREANTREKTKTENAVMDKRADEVLMSTCHFIEGYTVTKHLGLVFGECLFKSGFSKSITASIDNLVDVFSVGDKELSGSAKLLEDARQYALKKMCLAAVKKGANAVIGFDSESSFGSDILHITVYGTAVRVEPIEQ